MTESMFKLRRPCKRCPFRTDVEPYIRSGRAAEIARGLAEGEAFSCHETTVDGVEVEEDGTEQETLVNGPDSQFCAGALIVMEKQGQTNQAVRIAERLGLYDAAAMDMEAPVYPSLVAFVHGHEEEEPECCSVANAGCLAPAGMMVGGMVVAVEPDGEVHECPCCGEPVCEECSDEAGNCVNCVESGYVVG